MKGKNPFAVDTSYFTLRAYRLSNDLYKVQVSSTDSLHSLTSILSSLTRSSRVVREEKEYARTPFPLQQRKHTDMAFLIECVGMNRIHDLIHRNITRYRDLESVFCPALDAKVHFTLKAWKHILGLEKGQKKRSRKEIEERLVLIMQSPRVLSMAQTYDEIRVQKGRTYYSFVFSDPNGSWIAVVMRDKERIFRLVSVFRRYKKASCLTA